MLINRVEIEYSTNTHRKGVAKMKKLFTLLLGVLLVFTTVSPSVSNAAGSTNLNNNNEVLHDELGNKIELEYIDNEFELRVNTYVNGMLTDYSIAKKTKDTNATKIVNYILENPIPKTSLSTLNQSNYKFADIKTYNLEELIEKVEPSITPDKIETKAVPGGMTWVKSGRNGYDPYVGHLYVESTIVKTTKYMYDWATGVAISVIATAITIVWGAPIVAVGVLLGSLGVTFASSKITTPLSGWYDAYHHSDQYLVIVNDVWALWHKNDWYDVVYYNDRNGKRESRFSPQSNWKHPDDIILDGIQRYKMGGNN